MKSNRSTARAFDLRCVRCGARLAWRDRGDLQCQATTCSHVYPVVGGVPVVFHDERSVFSTSAFLSAPRTTYAGGEAWAKRIAKLLPSNSVNVCRTDALRRLASALADKQGPKLLVIGCGDGNLSYGPLERLAGVEILEADVSLEGQPAIVCDGHDLPFDNETFDLVVCEAVLEHVLDPFRCVAEIHRVLKTSGFVFATTPFMQQVHLGPFDFVRFTRSGHRALFAQFDEVESGIATGPASVLVWGVEYFLLSWTRRVAVRRAIKGLVRLALGWLPLLDHLLARREAAFDGAGGFYFIGRAAPGRAFAAKDAIAYYRGCDDAK
jgi:SAM-dependent methyltransferase